MLGLNEMSDILQELIIDGNCYHDKTDDSYRIMEWDTVWGKLYKIQVYTHAKVSYIFEIPDIHISLENAVKAARQRLFLHVDSICELFDSPALMIDGQFKKEVKIADGT